MSFDELFNVGILASKTVGEPGTQGAVVMGIQGIGTSAPIAAAEAAATIGLAIDWHIPNGRILTIGLLSIMFASGTLVSTKFKGKTIRVPGATPKVHFNMAPMHT
jgi:hypothetical protein